MIMRQSYYVSFFGGDGTICNIFAFIVDILVGVDIFVPFFFRHTSKSASIARIMQKRVQICVVLVKKLREESVRKRIAITELVDQKAIDIVAYTCPRLNQILISKSDKFMSFVPKNNRNDV